MTGRGIRLSRATFRYGALPVLWEIEFEVPFGRGQVIVGENGAGKSTLLYLAAALLPPTAGEVQIGGVRAGQASPDTLFRAGVRRGFVFQGGALLANHTALANVQLALRYHADVLGLDDVDVSERARAALAELRVTQADLHALPAHLSYGVRKRVAFARALALDPNFVFLDEPLTGLDDASAGLILRVVEGWLASGVVTLLAATHDERMMACIGGLPLELAGARLYRARDGTPSSEQ